MPKTFNISLKLLLWIVLQPMLIENKHQNTPDCTHGGHFENAAIMAFRFSCWLGSISRINKYMPKGTHAKFHAFNTKCMIFALAAPLICYDPIVKLSISWNGQENWPFYEMDDPPVHSLKCLNLLSISWNRQFHSFMKFDVISWNGQLNVRNFN